MKILLITTFFPPANSIASVRTGKMAAYFEQQGHDVRVITAKDVGYPETLECELEKGAIIRCEWFNLNRTLRSIKNKILNEKNINQDNQRTTNSSGETRSFSKRLFSSLTSIPDFCWGWIKPAKMAGHDLFKTWRPDIIYASGGPFSSFFIARELSDKYNVPWVAEYRDLWSNNDYYPHLPLRQKLDIQLEKSVCKTASAITVVSHHLGDIIKQSGKPFEAKPIEIIMNGYDEKDYAEDVYLPSSDDILHIAYTGNVYIDKGRHNPRKLFKALSLLNTNTRSKIRITFYRRGMGFIKNLATEFGVEDCIVLAGEVDFKEAVKQQQLADVLLYFLWNGPQADGTFSAKLFEYAGAGRPILAIGDKETGAVCDLIEGQNLGSVHSNEEKIAEFLQKQLKAKQEEGHITPPPQNSRLNLRRSIQFEKLEVILKKYTS